MSKKFEQLSIKPGFMKHNGGLLFKEISETEYEFKTMIDKNHLNSSGITHGGYIASIIDAGAGTGAHRAAGNVPCVTVSLDVKFIGATKIQKKTKNLVFLICHLQSKGKVVASASGIWKILNSKPIPKSGFGG